MDTLRVTLPEAMKAFVDERVSEGRYKDASEYVCELIQADRRRKAEEHLDALLLEGLESGASIEADAEFWERKKQGLVERASPKKGQ
jgi:antitoxin ParD1/3/4